MGLSQRKNKAIHADTNHGIPSCFWSNEKITPTTENNTGKQKIHASTKDTVFEA
jgi:hypothetical protein